MRRMLGALALVAAAGVLAALAYASYTTEQEFVRLLAAGDQAVADGRPFEALEAYSGAAALVPDAAVPYLKRGRVYQQQDEYESALRDLRRASDIDPSATRPLEWLGDISLDLSRSDRAVEYYRRYLALDDRNPRVFYKLGVSLYRAGQPADAVGPLDDALRLDATLTDARYVLGLCQRDLDALAQARTSLEQVVADAPADARAREALADVYAQLGEHQRGIDQLEALATLDPT
ncbi:MAG: tetratricopeptide repeat protein, partial [Vicinamibacterales bacterium]